MSTYLEMWFINLLATLAICYVYVFTKYTLPSMIKVLQAFVDCFELKDDWNQP